MTVSYSRGKKHEAKDHDHRHAALRPDVLRKWETGRPHIISRAMNVDEMK